MSRLSLSTRQAYSEYDGGANVILSRFSDVSLLCEKTGNTNLPMSNTVKRAGRGSGDEANGRSSKYATTGRRAQSIRSRNLYKVSHVLTA